MVLRSVISKQAPVKQIGSDTGPLHDAIEPHVSVDPAHPLAAHDAHFAKMKPSDFYQEGLTKRLATKIGPTMNGSNALENELLRNPVHIVILELFMDVGASVAFVSEPPAPGAMDHPPRDPARRFLDDTQLSVSTPPTQVFKPVDAHAPCAQVVAVGT